MQYTRRNFISMMGAVAGMSALASLPGCSSARTEETTTASNGTSSSTTSSKGGGTCSVPLSAAAWNYDADNDLYYQIGAVYCAAPQATDYESCAIYVPRAYFQGTQNADGTYTCEIDTSRTVAGFDATTAPIVMPVNTGGYAAQAAATQYDGTGLSTYMEAGFVYVYSGCRGKTNGYDSAGKLVYPGGAPWGVTDLKACVRFLRGNSSLIPGDMDRIFTFGHSGGGAQSALMGATGDSELYQPYLQEIGAVMQDSAGNTISDAICGSMCWCPITSLDAADEAYEWNMGQFATSGTRADTSFASQLSKDLATSYAEYINALKLTADGKTLTLEASDSGIYQKGSYYDYLLSVVETSLNNFLSDTTFPYTPTQQAEFPGGMTGTFGGGTTGAAPGGMPTGGQMPTGTTGTDTSASTTSTTYQTAQEYIDSLNGDTPWITYDAASNTAKVTSLEAFVTNCKTATKSVGAFDEVDRGQGENTLFGNGSDTAKHFDQTLADLLKKNADTYAKFSDWDAAYVTDCASDLAEKDEIGSVQQTRVDMYNPMYFLCDYYKGSGTSTVAQHWRIRTGIDQSDTALNTETNLALALKANSKVKDVDFATVWGMKHVEAERTGDKTTNFIQWVSDCVSAK